ncbi:MAG: glycoside hydrolase family 43 protein [Verrucomicrobiae bacterium]|nr:glycoside hydrolase family 43 protein [Verrucomicrobiae bacterium]
MKHCIRNPIIHGFNPDPSIVRAGDDYYIANSTFEWFPGVPIHHSRDLVNWKLIGHALTRQSQLDLRGIVDSAGVWAPSMSYADGQFWLIYTNLFNTGMGRPFKDIGIYLTTATDINGPWSEPVGLNAIGFDPSLFHDDDGRKWLANIEWDYRKGRHRFAGIVIQEYDPKQRKLVGPMTKILEKPNILCEGPNLYKHDGWYYLMMAEGGTGWTHSISMARSRNILGPYELDPQPVVLTARDDISLPLQKAGHGELVQTQSGEWYLAHLASRPLITGAGLNQNSPDKSSIAALHAGHRCMLGRETCLQKVEWRDGWLRLATGGTKPQTEVPAPADLPPHPWPALPERDDFDAAKLEVNWSSLRVPVDESWLSLTARPGWLRLRGRESQHSLHNQSLVARRLQHFSVTIETRLEFAPEHFTQSAGLICYYDTRTHFYLRVSRHEVQGKILGIVLTDDGVYDELMDSQVVINDWKQIYLRAQIDREKLQFSASPDGRAWQAVGPVLDASKLSDDYGTGLHFTGALVGLCCQDLKDHAVWGDFDYFEYRPRAA